eukprot:366101-Chlamydomonas_euryale.AAC.1
MLPRGLCGSSRVQPSFALFCAVWRHLAIPRHLGVNWATPGPELRQLASTTPPYRGPAACRIRAARRIEGSPDGRAGA